MENPFTHYDKTDTYPRFNVPDDAIETCLKVLRTIRVVCVTDPDSAIILSAAHTKILELTNECWTAEDANSVLPQQERDELEKLMKESRERQQSGEVWEEYTGDGK